MIAFPSQRRNSGRVWPMLIVGLILMNMGIVAITIYAATRDPSVATEPDYYAKALNFNETIRQREINAQLGWSADCSITATERNTELSVDLRDRAGRPITGATVSAVAFASARSGQRQTLTLASSRDTPGVYAAPIRIERAGLWIVRVSVRHADGVFTHDTELMIPVSRGGT